MVFASDEADLFNAGFTVSHDDRSVRVIGTDAEGFRGGVSRVVSDYCDALISIATLRADPETGFAGCVANALCCVPNVQRVALRRTPEQLGEPAGLPAVRQKLKLNLLEAYLPLLDTQGANKITWQYKGLLAGVDPVAVDTVGRGILRACRDAQRGQPWPLASDGDYLQVAQERYRLGQSDRTQIAVKLLGYEKDSYLP